MMVRDTHQQQCPTARLVTGAAAAVAGCPAKYALQCAVVHPSDIWRHSGLASISLAQRCGLSKVVTLLGPSKANLYAKLSQIVAQKKVRCTVASTMEEYCCCSAICLPT